MEDYLELVGKGRSDYVIAIPSYNRVKLLGDKTLKVLQDNKIEKEVIYIFVANKKEYDLYKSAYPEYNVVTGVKGLLKQRNFMTKYFKEGQRILYMDDDITDIVEKVGEGTRKVNLTKFLPFAFDLCEKEGLYLWGIYPVANPFYAKRTITTDLRFILGTFYGVINRHSKDLLLKITSEKEDSERTLRYYKKDGGVLRFNYIFVKTRFFAPGGMVTELGSAEERFKQGADTVEKLLKEFPGYGRKKVRKSGVTEFVFIRNPKV